MSSHEYSSLYIGDDPIVLGRVTPYTYGVFLALSVVGFSLLASLRRVFRDHRNNKDCSVPRIHNFPLELDAVVVGAGWAGLWSLYKLKKQGLRVRLLEANPDVGGVWYYSRYPGCRNDTEVPLYEYSEPELWQNWDWSERFPAQPEIHRYLTWVSRKLDIRDNITFGTRVSRARWDERNSVWEIFSKDGHYANARFFLPCSGYTTIKYVPQFQGADSFKHAYHTSQWPAGLDCRGKRVGIIGNAASGIQMIEALGSKVSHLTVFQRTPNLATPMGQEKYTATRMRELKRGFPQRFANRVSRNGYDIPSADRSTFDDTPEQRQTFYESLWQRGGLAFWFSNYKDLLTSIPANDEAYAFWRSKVLPRIRDPATAAMLAPLRPPHAFGTKRPSLETAYFEVYNQANVSLVDVAGDPIRAITPQGISTLSGQLHELDIIVFATGFDFFIGSMLAMGIEGVGGRRLDEKWANSSDGSGVWPYLGMMTAGFPNMFFPMGPQAPSALGLTPQMAEVQGNWIAECVAYMIRQGSKTIEPRREAERRWKKEVERAAEATLMGKIDSWYLGVNIPGRKKEALCYFGGVDKYIGKIDQCRKDRYEGFIIR